MNLTSLLRRAIIIGICATVFVPIFVSNDLFFPFITGKNFAFRIITEFIFACWLILLLKDPSVRPRPLAVLYVFGAFVFSLFISAMFGMNPDKSFWSNFERMEGWVGLAHLGAYFLVLTSFLNTEKLWKTLFASSVGVSVAVGVFGLFQLAGAFPINQGGVRMDATLGNATYLAIYALFNLFLTLLLFFKRNDGTSGFWSCYGSFSGASVLIFLIPVLLGTPVSSISAPLIFSFLILPQIVFWGLYGLGWLVKIRDKAAIFYVLAILLQLLMLFEAESRGTILGLVGGLFLTGLIYALFGKDSPKLRKWGAGVVIAVVVVVGGFVLLKNVGAFEHASGAISRLASISLSEGQTRFTVWNIALKGFVERPLFGWGQENFNYVFNKYYDPSLYAQEPWFDRAHNVILDWLIAGGAVGLLLYLSVYAVTIWYLTRKNDAFPLWERGLLIGLLAAHAIHNLFVFDNLVSYMLFLAVIAYIAIRTNGSLTTASSQKAVSGPTFKVAAPAIVIVALCVFYFANVPGIATGLTLIEAVKPHPEGLTKNFEYFKQAATSSDLGRQEVREQLIQFAVQVQKMTDADAAFKSEVLQFAVEQLRAEVARNPDDARLRIFLGSLLRQTGDPDGGKVELEKALTLSPGKPTVYMELGILEYDRGNAAESLARFKQAFDLEPLFDTARLFYAATAIRTGQRDLAASLLMPRYGTVTPNDPYILQAYIDIKDYASVLAVAKARVESDPNNPQTHLDLASGYLMVGDKASAISEIREAIKLKPDFSTQGESYIKDIQAGKNI